MKTKTTTTTTTTTTANAIDRPMTDDGDARR